MAQKTFEKAKKIMPLLAIISFLFMQVFLVSAADTDKYDEILKPIQAIYDYDTIYKNTEILKYFVQLIFLWD